MQVVHAQRPFPDSLTSSLFLAGPTPRSPQVASWRPEALRLLEARGYPGAVFVPEDAAGGFSGTYEAQVAWELEGLRRADCVLFWIPRDLATMPAFTTNVEFGAWVGSGKAVLGAPPGAPKLRYLQLLADRLRVPRSDTLAGALEHALAMVGAGAPRTGAECEVPLHVFRTPAFQSWYGALRRAGNSLCGASLEWTRRVGPERDLLFYWALHVDVWIAREQRHKKNELVLARPDISAVVLYRRDRTDPGASQVVLIREFRSPVNTADGYVRELPSGSSLDPSASMESAALEEVHEEAGFTLAPERLRPVGVRQLAATMSAHRAHVFAAELTIEELQAFLADAGTVHGADPGERTAVEVWTLEQLLEGSAVDWSTLGMVMAALK